MSRIRIETRARSRALQALYAWDVRGERGGRGQSVERVAESIWDDLPMTPGERALARELVRTVAQRCDSIDAELAEATVNWRLERLGAIERSVLRLAAGELLRGCTPPRVVIQEGVRLAERYGSEQSARFVNGVLDAVARRMGKL